MSDAIENGKAALTPHLIINGASEAIDFYVQAFGAVEHYRMPMPDGRLGHAQIQIGKSSIMLADEFPEWGCVSPLARGGSSVVLHLQVADADAVFDRAVEAGATVKMPLDNMFWGDRYGKLTDPFGHEWSIGQTIEQLTPQEMKARGDAAFAEMHCPEPATV